MLLSFSFVHLVIEQALPGLQGDEVCICIVPLGSRVWPLHEGVSKLGLGRIGVWEIDSPWLGTKMKWGTGRCWLFFPLAQLILDGVEKMGGQKLEGKSLSP